MENIELKTHKGIVRIGTRIRIIHLNNGSSSIDDSDCDGREGTVCFFDRIPPEANPGMHGTWGGLAVYDSDDFEILTGYEDELKAFAREEREAREENGRIEKGNALIIDEIKRYGQSISEQKKIIAELRTGIVTGRAGLPSPKRIVEALARELASRLSLHQEVSGPQGLRCEYRIRLFDCTPEGLSPTERRNHLVRRLTLTADGNYPERLSYDTGEVNCGPDACAPGSVGAANGFNNRQAPLPENIEEIIRILEK